MRHSVHAPYDATTRGLLRGSLLTCIALVACASLYPFTLDISAGWAALSAGASGLMNWRDPTRRDLIVNLIAYVPIGFLLTGLLAAERRVAMAATLAVAIGAGGSLTIELAQHFVPVRVPSLADFSYNVVSTLLGALLWPSLRVLPLRPIAARLRRPDIGLTLGLLSVLWISAHAAPFLPRTRWIRVRESLQPLLDFQFDPQAFALHVASAIVLATILRAVVRRDSFWPLFIQIVLLSFGARLMFVEQQLALAQLLGLVVALPIIFGLRGRNHRAALTPALVVISVALLVSATAPWDFGTSTPFSWSPLSGLGSGLLDGDYRHVIERAFVLLGALWIGSRTALGLGLTSLLLLGIAAGGEVMHRFLDGRIADTTDIAMVLLGAALLHLVDGKARAG